MRSKFCRKWRWLSLMLIFLFLFSSTPLVGAAPGDRPGLPSWGGVGHAPGEIPGEIVVKFRAGSKSAQKSLLSALGAKEVAVARTGAVLLRLPEGRLVQDALRQLQADPGVEYAEPNRQRKVTRLAAASVSEDTYLDLQWNLPAVRAFEAWRELEVISGSVTVAVVDTGVDPSHPELSGRIASGGRNFVATRSDGTSYNPDDTSDDHGHGTHVAGIITAVYGNGRGLAGVAGPASIPVLPVKVLNDQGWGTSFAVGRGIIHAADQGARVINLSL
ncbi:MAG: S8 family serine peptidase, partial [Bacillota bacterium]|nr:S8 family serine peptidase [Bacillota bacterium]